MLQIPCPGCGNYISSRISACPYCGRTKKSLLQSIKENAVVIGVLINILVFGAIFLQYTTMDKQLNVMKIQLEKNRPFIALREFRSTFNNEYPDITLVFQNAGTQGALFKVWVVASSMDPRNLSLPIDETGNANGVIMPGGTFNVPLSNILKNRDWKKIASGKEELWLYMYVVYGESKDKCKHKTIEIHKLNVELYNKSLKEVKEKKEVKTVVFEKIEGDSY